MVDLIAWGAFVWTSLCVLFVSAVIAVVAVEVSRALRERSKPLPKPDPRAERPHGEEYFRRVTGDKVD